VTPCKVGIRIELVMLILLTAGICFNFIHESTRYLPLHKFATIILCISLVAARIPRIKTPSWIDVPQRGILFLFLSMAALIYLVKTPLPVNTISLTVRPIKYASDCTLRQSLPGHRVAFQHVAAPPDHGWQTIHFVLPRPLVGIRKAFRISFNNMQHRYEIAKISFSTLILWTPVPMHTYRNEEMVPITGTVSTLNTLAMKNGTMTLSSKHNQGPFLHILANENHIRAQISTWRNYELKGIWFVIYLIAIISAFTFHLFVPWLQWLKKRLFPFLLT